MSAHVLLNLFNKLRKNYKCEFCLTFYRFFRNKFYKFNYTGARMLDSIYHRTLKLLKKSHFWCKNVKILPSYTQCYNGQHYVTVQNL